MSYHFVNILLIFAISSPVRAEVKKEFCDPGLITTLLTKITECFVCMNDTDDIISKSHWYTFDDSFCSDGCFNIGFGGKPKSSTTPLLDYLFCIVMGIIFSMFLARIWPN